MPAALVEHARTKGEARRRVKEPQPQHFKQASKLEASRRQATEEHDKQEARGRVSGKNSCPVI